MMCEENSDKEDVAKKSKDYINKLINENQKYVSFYYENNNEKIFSQFDLDEVKFYHDLISNEQIIDYTTLSEALNFIPIRFINFYLEKIDIEENKICNKYKISYLNKHYKNSINKYLEQFKTPNYEKKDLKPGEKGDIFERVVIESIEEGYFNNFIPDKIVILDEIFTLIEYTNRNDPKFEEIIKTFEEIFLSGKYNLIMIKQSKPNAKRYDLAFIQKYDERKYQIILVQITTRKDSKAIKQYLNVKTDCYNLANFFSLFDVDINMYHFLFIFKAGFDEDKASMKFCEKNNIKYIKYGQKNREQYFLSRYNEILNDLIFDLTSYSLVDLINNELYQNLDNLPNSSELSFMGRKRATISHISQAKYMFGINIYNLVSKIFKGKNYELCEKVYALEEEKIFHIYQKRNQNNKILYYLVYLKKGQKQIEIINEENSDNDEEEEDDNKHIKLQKKLEKPGTLIECFKFI